MCDCVVQHNGKAGAAVSQIVGDITSESVVQGNLNPDVVLIRLLVCPHGPLERMLSQSNEVTDQQVKRRCARSVGLISQGHSSGENIQGKRYHETRNVLVPGNLVGLRC